MRILRCVRESERKVRLFICTITDDTSTCRCVCYSTIPCEREHTGQSWSMELKDFISIG